MKRKLILNLNIIFDKLTIIFAKIKTLEIK